MGGLQAGMALSPMAFPAITREQLRAYAEASGDHNPIHLDEEVAKKAGLPGIIAHGMLIAGFMAERAERFMREQGGKWKPARFQTRFKGMTLLGDVITVSGMVKEARESETVVEVQATNQRGETVTSGVLRFARA